MMTLDVTWQVEDGYVGGSRPHHTKIRLDDYVDDIESWNQMSQEEKDDIIRDIVREDFEQRIDFSITTISET
jgi:hypothetical protein